MIETVCSHLKKLVVLFRQQILHLLRQNLAQKSRNCITNLKILVRSTAMKQVGIWETLDSCTFPRSETSSGVRMDTSRGWRSTQVSCNCCWWSAPPKPRIRVRETRFWTQRFRDVCWRAPFRKCLDHSEKGRVMKWCVVIANILRSVNSHEFLKIILRWGGILKAFLTWRDKRKITNCISKS